MTLYLVVQCFVLVFIVSMFFDIMATIQARMRTFRQTGDRPSGAIMVSTLIDIVTICCVIAMISQRLPQQIDSAKNTEKILGNLANIAWDSNVIPVDEKKEKFFSTVQVSLGSRCARLGIL